MASPKTMAHQFQLAERALHEADHLAKARYWTSCVSQSFQVVLRAAAGLLYGLGLPPQTEREVRVAFASAFVSAGHSTAKFDAAFRKLEAMRNRADFDHDHVSTEGEAREALALAHDFWNEAMRLRNDVLKEHKEALK